MIGVRQKLIALGESAREDRWRLLSDLAKVTALKHSPSRGFFAGHWWRGPLLYTLVQASRPRHVLEFGTGRGLGATAMAQAAADGGWECTVWTIDQISTDQRQSWALDLGQGPVIRHLSLDEVWSAYLPPAVRRSIKCLTGRSDQVMRSWTARKLPPVDFCFIDGGHDYWTVKHDFLAALRVAQPHCQFLF